MIKEEKVKNTISILLLLSIISAFLEVFFGSNYSIILGYVGPVSQVLLCLALFDVTRNKIKRSFLFFFYYFLILTAYSLYFCFDYVIYLNDFYKTYTFDYSHLSPILSVAFGWIPLVVVYFMMARTSINAYNGVKKVGKYFLILAFILLISYLDRISNSFNNENTFNVMAYVLYVSTKMFPFYVVSKLSNPAVSDYFDQSSQQVVMKTGISESNSAATSKVENTRFGSFSNQSTEQYTIVNEDAENEKVKHTSTVENTRFGSLSNQSTEQNTMINEDDITEKVELTSTSRVELTTASKIGWTILIWVFWAFFASAIFGDGSSGTIIQGLVQIGGTIYVWTRPKPNK
jgi:hypothetical protein